MGRLDVLRRCLVHLDIHLPERAAWQWATIVWQMTATDDAAINGMPRAVVDTNVLLAIFSWHDFIITGDTEVRRDPNATLLHPNIQFRAQRARQAFFLTLMFHERQWTTLMPLNEVVRLMTVRVPPASDRKDLHLRKSEGDDASLAQAKLHFTTLYLYFVKDLLLPGWQPIGDPSEDLDKVGNQVDLLCLAQAEKERLPLISWEGHGPSGFNPSKLIPAQAKERGIDLVTPSDLLSRERFDPSAPLNRFFASWAEKATHFLQEGHGPGAPDALSLLYDYYLRLADDDWTP